jgi:multisubunit Na+/H+ antiporter MnhE subunit
MQLRSLPGRIGAEAASRAVAFMALFGLYLGLAGALAWAEIVAAALSSAIAVALSLWLHRAAERRFRLHPDWIVLSIRIARHVLGDCLIVTRALIAALARRRHITGVFRELRWETHEDPREAASLRAFVTIGISLAPNSYVVDVRADEQRLIIHHLVPPPEPNPGKPASREIWLP